LATREDCWLALKVHKEAMMEGELQIRLFQAEDQQRAREVVLVGFGERFGFINEALNPDLDDILDTYIAAGDIFVVGYVGRELVATGALVKLEDELSEMVRISTCKEYRKRGIASAIIRHLIELARQRGDRRIIIKTRLDWEDAITLYKRLGFTEFGRAQYGIGLELWLRSE